MSDKYIIGVSISYSGLGIRTYCLGQSRDLSLLHASVAYRTPKKENCEFKTLKKETEHNSIIKIYFHSKSNPKTHYIFLKFKIVLNLSFILTDEEEARCDRNKVLQKDAKKYDVNNMKFKKNWDYLKF